MRYLSYGDVLEIFDSTNGCKVDYSPYYIECFHICSFIGLCFIAIYGLFGFLYLEISLVTTRIKSKKKRGGRTTTNKVLLIAGPIIVLAATISIPILTALLRILW